MSALESTLCSQAQLQPPCTTACLNCFSFEQPARGAYLDLLLAWDVGFRRVVLQVDSLDGRHYLRNDSSVIHNLKWHFEELTQRNWIVKIQHVLHEGNKMVDALAKITSFATTVFADPPLPVISLLHADIASS
ncbi:uncharacterized protein LOC120193432 [Hibiscus syriacus]|uniref:uncharacterized protein LOC120193432 n=1 Tax=Hibiscus syriacus TaxID=106335 RepID=UPI001922A381|nr:uncharacterized protein LOC120193432 [Hibiscus syriacus]